MPDTTTNTSLASKLEDLLFSAASGLVESAKSLTGASMKMIGGELASDSAESIAASLGQGLVLIRGALENDFAGQSLRIVMTAGGATTLAGRSKSEDSAAIQQRIDAGKLEGEDLEAFNDVANAICSGVDTKLRDQLGASVGLHFDEFQVGAPESGGSSAIGSGEFVIYRFNMQVEEFPEAVVSLLVDRATAEAWNGGQLGLSGTLDSFGDAFLYENIPTRGTIACSLADSEPYRIVRRACRRAGLDLDNRPTSEVPNPAAYRGKLVLIDVPVRDERRFNWCKRLKEYEPTCRVLLMIRQPSRQRVVRGFLSKADVIVGWPLEEVDLFTKLDAMASELFPAEPEDGDADKKA